MGSFDAKAIGTTLALDIFEGRLRGHADDPYGATVYAREAAAALPPRR